MTHHITNVSNVQNSYSKIGLPSCHVSCCHHLFDSYDISENYFKKKVGNKQITSSS